MLPTLHLPTLGAVSTYAIVQTAYIVLALGLTMRLNQRQGVDAGVTLTVFALALPASMIGAHLLDALEYWGRYQSLGDLLGRRGSSIYGGFLAAFAVAWLYVRSQGIAPLKVFDAGAPTIALGEAATRIGCFLNGCCYGVEWRGPWAVTFPAESFAYQDQLARGVLAASATRSLAVHPVQLYSTVAMLGVALYLLRQFRQPHRTGDVFFQLLVAYGSLRLLVAPLRVEALASMKVFSVAFILVGFVGLLPRRPAAVASTVPRLR